MTAMAGTLGAGSLLSPAVQELTARMQETEVERSALHARQCRQAADLHRAHVAAGEGDFVADEIAVLLSCTDHRAQTLLAQGLRLAQLDGGFALLEEGHFTVEQTAAIVEETQHLTVADADTVVRTVRSRHSAATTGAGLRGAGPVRAAVRRAAQQLALDTAVKQRQRAEAQRRLEWWISEDGMLSLKATLPAATGLAVLEVIRGASGKQGAWDERSAAQRRADAFAALVLGQHGRGLVDGVETGVDVATGEVLTQPTCAPCQPLVHVHVPLGTALGSSDESATLVGYGSIDAEQARHLVHSGAALLRVLTDPVTGIPLHVDAEPVRPGSDRAAVRSALEQMAASALGARPPDHFPLAPDDHPGPHPPDSAGSYRPSASLRRFLRVRSPRCEWPGCGQPAKRCDVDHDTAWPEGPTCSCNLGTLCRHHHQVKQSGWTKTRQGDGSVMWTSPTGQRALGEPQHPQPAPASGGLRLVEVGTHSKDEPNSETGDDP